MKPIYKMTSVLGVFLIVFMSCSDGLKKREIKKNGKIVMQWFEKVLENGKVVKHGMYIKWYENSQKAFEVDMVNGKENGKKSEWYENGQKAFEVDMVNGKENGKKLKWYANGQKKCEGVMVDGKGNGRWTKYYSNGQAWIQSDWDKGKFLGKTTMWDFDGKKKKNFSVFESEYGLSDQDTGVNMWNMIVDYDFFITFKMEIVAGRTFSKQFENDKTSNAIINETAADELGRGDHLGKRLNNEKVIIGVVKDFFEFETPIILTLSTDDKKREGG